MKAKSAPKEREAESLMPPRLGACNSDPSDAIDAAPISVNRNRQRQKFSLAILLGQDEDVVHTVEANDNGR
jgi:hypothetical protein